MLSFLLRRMAALLPVLLVVSLVAQLFSLGVPLLLQQLCGHMQHLLHHHDFLQSLLLLYLLRIALHRPAGSEQLVILVVEDNLVKGAAGQGVQCMNLMFGLDETTGLRHVPVMP